ncbi:MAG: DMT family transporter [Roseivirga sp.]|nr:DMT family transporter [Roseivirga sp.]
MKNQKVLAWGLLVILSLIWGSSFILIKRGLEVFTAGEVGALRILAACIFLLPVSLPKLSKLSVPHMKLLFFIGLLGSFIPAFLFAIGQTRLDSGITGVLNGLTPIFVLIMGVIFYKQKATRDKILGLIMAFVGTAVLLLAGSGGDLSQLNYYALFIVLATICYGANLNIIKFHLADLNPVVITSVSILFVGPLAAIYLFTSTDFSVTLTSVDGAWRALGFISLLGVMGTAIALILFNKLVQLTTPIFTSTVTYFIPIVAIVWGLIDGEVLITGQILGIAAIFAGVFITNRKK